ncbi:MAG TPA: hypothetical protein VFO85_01130 [Vicinamibacteria bacterium]|nr:hypothetical protein [Vicinamibacteria bacterium]
MALTNNAPAPINDPISLPRRKGYSDENPDPQEGMLSKAWQDYYAHQTGLQEQFPARVRTVELKDQNASVSATDFSGGTLTAGWYRVNYNLRVMGSVPADTVQVVIDWQDENNTRSRVGEVVDMGFDTESDEQTLMIRVAHLTPVRYTVNYVGAGISTWGLDIVLEEVRA